MFANVLLTAVAYCPSRTWYILLYTVRSIHAYTYYIQYILYTRSQIYYIYEHTKYTYIIYTCIIYQPASSYTRAGVSSCKRIMSGLHLMATGQESSLYLRRLDVSCRCACSHKLLLALIKRNRISIQSRRYVSSHCAPGYTYNRYMYICIRSK